MTGLIVKLDRSLDALQARLKALSPQRSAALGILIAALLVVPWLGSTGLTSPWEAQYAEVSREMTATGDYIYPTYRNVGFFSKPVLTMWLTAPGLSLTGGWMSDGVHSEWMPFAVRLPIALLLLLLAWSCHWAVSRIWDRQTALLSTVVLVTCPFVLLAGRQAVTDMPFLALHGSALFLLAGYLFGASSSEEEDDGEIDSKAALALAGVAGFVSELTVGLLVPSLDSGLRLLIALVVFVGLLVHFSRSGRQEAKPTWSQRMGLFKGRPTDSMPLWFPLLLACFFLIQVVWLTVTPEPEHYMGMRRMGPQLPVRLTTIVILILGGGGLCHYISKQKRSDLPIFGFYALVGLATLAKGFGGPLIPGAVALVYIITAWDWGVLKRVRLVSGPLLALVIGGPWFLVMFNYTGRDEEGKTFFSRFIIHDHVNRVGGGIHGDESKHKLGFGFTYYMRYLSYGLFPWAMGVPLALVDAGLHREAEDRRRRAVLFLLAWFGTTFLLFTLMATKFHHYALPIVPPLAILVGIWLTRVARGESRWSMGLALLAIIFGISVGSDLAKFPWEWMDLTTYHYINYKPNSYFPGNATGQCDLGYSYCSIFGIIPVTLALDWRFIVGCLVGVVVALILLASLGVVIRGQQDEASGRRWVVSSWILGALITGTFVSHVYFPMLSQHWTHANVIETYFKQRSPGEDLVAYQMNWHGETFYARNLEHQVNDGKRLKAIVERPGTSWVLTERSRFDGMTKTLGSKYKPKIHIVDRSNVKWFLVRIDD